MNNSKKLDKYLFARKLDKIILIGSLIFLLAGVFYWQWNNDKRVFSENITGTMIGFDKGLNGTDIQRMLLVELADGEKVKVNIRPGTLMIKNRKVEVLKSSNSQTGISYFEMIKYFDENN